jgi:hypothetical protein
MRYIALPGVTYVRWLKPSDGSGWWRVPDPAMTVSDRDYLTDLGRRMDPSLLYPGLSRLKVTRGRPLKVDGVTCWPYTVRMTLRQNLGSMPQWVRWDNHPPANGTTVTTFSVDVTGLPHKVVEASLDGHSRLNAVTVLTRWGSTVTVSPPA